MAEVGRWFDATISSGERKTSAIDIGRDYDFLELMIPGMDSCKLYLQVSEREEGTYYDLGNDATTNEENFNRAAIWTLGGFRFIKVVSSVVQNQSVTIRIRGMRN